MGQENVSYRRQALSTLLSQAAVHSPYYRDQGWAARLRGGEDIRFRDIPITPKALVRTQTALFYSSFVPPDDGPVKDKPTSGSTGEPMLIRKTRRQFQINTMENRRLKMPWDYYRHLRLVTIDRPSDIHPIGTVEERDLPGGRRSWNLYNSEAQAAFEILRRTSASVVVGPPSVLWAALERALDSFEALPLQLVMTLTEVVPDELRELVGRIPSCRLADMYGCIEAGLIALQCPTCGAYHPADRQLLIELVTEDDKPAASGQLGRVIVTPFFGTAMPLIRYETGDYAVMGQRNHCPRSAYSIKKIIGRELNLFKLPDGRRVLPRLAHSAAHQLGLRKFKLIQTSLTDLEMQYVPRDNDTQIAQDVVQGMVNRHMAPGFKVRCVPVPDLPRAPNGKYLMHECRI